MATPEQQKAFIAKMAPYAIEWSKRTGIPPEVYIAIGASESNWGATGTFFGIKGQGTAGSQNFATWESVNGQPVQTRADFAVYNDPNEAFQHFTDLTSTGRYKPAYDRFQQDRDINAFLRGINTAGYATDPQWASKITLTAGSVRPQIPQSPGGPAMATPQQEDQAQKWFEGRSYDQLDGAEKAFIDKKVKELYGAAGLGVANNPNAQDRWTGNGPQGYGTYILDASGKPGQFIGDTRAPGEAQTPAPRTWTGTPSDGRPYGTYNLDAAGQPVGQPIGNPRAPTVPKVSSALQQAQQGVAAQDLRAKVTQGGATPPRSAAPVERSESAASPFDERINAQLSPQQIGSPGTEGWNKPSVTYGVDQQGQRAGVPVYNRPNPGGGGTSTYMLTPGMLGQLLGPFGTTPSYDPKTRSGDPLRDIAAWEAAMAERARVMAPVSEGGRNYDVLQADKSFLGRKDAGPYAYGNVIDQSGRNMGPARGYSGLYGADRADDPTLSIQEWLAMVTPEETTDGYEPYDPQSMHAGGQVIANQNGYFGRGNGYGPPSWVFDYLGGGGPPWAQQMQAPMLARGGSVQASPYTTVGGRNIAGWDDPQSRNYQAGSPVQESRDPMFGWARGREDNRRGSGGGGAGAVVSNWLPDKRYWVEGYGWLTEAEMQALGIDQTAGGDFQWESSLSKSPPLGGTTGVPSFAGGTNGPLITDEPMLGIGANSGDLRFTVGEPNALTGGAPTREMITGGGGTMNVTPMEPSVPMGPMANPMMPTAFAQLVESIMGARRGSRTPPLRPVGAASGV